MEFSEKIISQSLLANGLIQIQFEIEESILRLVKARDWKQLDDNLHGLVAKDGPLRNELLRYGNFQEVEFITSVREGPNDEEGIWHDDGSRIMAFTLGLNLEPVEGGQLLFRSKGSRAEQSLPAPKWGILTIFLTGSFGYEHKVTAVSKGFRVVMAGWCS